MTTKVLSPTAAIRAFCRQCHPEPRGEYLRCSTVDCPLWRHRAGNPSRFGKGGFANAADAHSRAVKCTKTSLVAGARLLILQTEAEVISTGKTQLSNVDCWPYGELTYKAGERPLLAIKRHCADCMGGVRAIKACCSPNCALAPYRFGRRPRPTDKAPVSQAMNG
ncbi:MAG TPA: hypothetical protein VM141_09535 [Planctomycetota bacterium]|nr:hypothetical protein [Planctomycetota bacterium]